MTATKKATTSQVSRAQGSVYQQLLRDFENVADLTGISSLCHFRFSVRLL